MRLFLTSHNLEQKHLDRLEELLGTKKVFKALFITTAAVPYGLDPKPAWLVESQDSLRTYAQNVDETTLEEESFIPESLEEYGFIFMSGGNSFYLAYRLAQTGMDRKIQDYIENDSGVYIGSSAGTIILMDSIEHFAPADDPQKAPAVYPGLSMLTSAIVPHADNAKYQGVMSQIAKAYQGDGYQVVSLNDNQVLIVEGGITQVI